MNQKIKKLDEKNLSKLQALENKLGCCIVAIEHEPKPANLSEVNLKELQAIARETDSILVAYQC